MSVAAIHPHVELAGGGRPLCNQQQVYCRQQRGCSSSSTFVADCTSAAYRQAPYDLCGHVQHGTELLGQKGSERGIGADLGDSSTGISDLLRQAGPQMVVLEQLMQKELAGIAGDEVTLGRIKSLVLQHQQQAGRTDVSATNAAAGTIGQNASSHRTVHVLPLLGLSLAQLLSLLQQHQHDDPAGVLQEHEYSALLQQLLASCTTPLTVATANGSSSDNKFLAALASEVLRLRQFVNYCYDTLKCETAKLGQHLPPVPVTPDDTSAELDNSSSSKPRGCDTVPVASGVCFRTASNYSSSSSSSGATANAELGTCSLAELQAQANSVCHALVQLDDFINNSYSKLARLAQQFDTLLTAAASDASQSSTLSQEDAQPSNSSKGSLLGLLAGRHKQQQQQKGGVLGRTNTPNGLLKCRVEFLLLTPGVCSHSSYNAYAQRYTAGVPPDIYHQTLHKLIALGHGPEPVLWGLSVLYARLRHSTEAAADNVGGQQPKTTAAAEWTAPDQFTRNTTKYWVHPSNILRLKLALLQHLPLLVYGASDPVYAGGITKVSLEANGRGVTSLIGSVYFDSPQLDVYHSRLSREDGAQLVRVRYYGPRQPAEADQQLFVERKTHHKRWTGERSVKERAPLAQAQLPPYLSGEVAPAELTSKESKQELLQQVLDYLRACNQVPAMRTEYMRTAWQRYDSNSVRFSLDEHMLLIREKQKMPTAGVTNSVPTANGEDWCASLEHHAQLPADETVRFPYGILEIKLQEEEPKWVEELKASGVLVKAPKFSKFCHGMALLYPDRCMHSPNWFIWDEATSSASPATMEQLVEQHIANGNDPGGLLQPEQSNGTYNSAPVPITDSLAFGPTLAPLRIPRLDPGSFSQTVPAFHLKAAEAASVPRPNHPFASRNTAAAGADDDIWHEEHCLSIARDAAVDAHVAAAETQCNLLWGAGLHTPTQPCTPTRMSGDISAGLCCTAPLSKPSRHGVCITDSHEQGDSSSGSYSRSKGGSGPFNSGINSSSGLPAVLPQKRGHLPAGSDSRQQTAHTSAACAYSSDTAALLPKSFPYSHAYLQQQQGHGAVSVNSRPISYPCDVSGEVLIVGAGGSGAGVAAPAPGGSSPANSVVSSSSGIKRLLGLVVGRRGKADSSTEWQAECSAKDVLSRQDTPSHHHILYVTNPLEAQHLRSKSHQHQHHHHGSTALSSCSTSSQETITTGSGGTARHYVPAHSRTSSSQGLPSIADASPTAADAAAAAAEMQWQISSKGSPDHHDDVVVKGVADQTYNDADYKHGHNHKGASGSTDFPRSIVVCQDSPREKVAGTELCRSLKDSARGLPGTNMVNPQHYVIQVNHVRQEPPAYGTLWPAGDIGSTGAAPHGTLQQQDSTLSKSMQQYVPPTNSNHFSVPGVPATATAVTAAAAEPGGKNVSDYTVQMNGGSGAGSSSNSSSGGNGGDRGKQSRARGLLQRLRAAAGRRRWRGRMSGAGGSGGGGGGAGGGNGRNEHLLGFAGVGPRSKTLVRARAEPKTFFANERTFLSWLQISVLVMMTGLGLLGGSTLMTSDLGPEGGTPDCMQITVCRASRISGAVVAPASVVCMLYALWTFKKRTWQIRHQMTTVRYDDQLGPVLLTVLLVVVTVVSIVLGLKALLYT